MRHTPPLINLLPGPTHCVFTDVMPVRLRYRGRPVDVIASAHVRDAPRARIIFADSIRVRTLAGHEVRPLPREWEAIHRALREAPLRPLKLAPAMKLAPAIVDTSAPGQATEIATEIGASDPLLGEPDPGTPDPDPIPTCRHCARVITFVTECDTDHPAAVGWHHDVIAIDCPRAEPEPGTCTHPSELGED